MIFVVVVENSFQQVSPENAKFIILPSSFNSGNGRRSIPSWWWWWWWWCMGAMDVVVLVFVT
jgi:hypothetical protein